MSNSEKVNCHQHGIMDYALVCQHLVNQKESDTPIEYFSGEDIGDLDESEVENVWCKSCDDTLIEQGEWNDVSEAFAAPKVICIACLQTIKNRNMKGEL
ncbi:hypothetical protein [Shewanella nanhaiensis]|uniref:Uncharacterized protein n=1 Tax=Shewanella nanhaiensis TaxID=2864872 RepID=A0ABS7E114_9GAMM|nr:hypothetical protein [Shewanella nanhaiensis]MBW8183367.1 hypothetical protein [Shewanella nanhaiensis]